MREMEMRAEASMEKLPWPLNDLISYLFRTSGFKTVTLHY